MDLVRRVVGCMDAGNRKAHSNALSGVSDSAHTPTSILSSVSKVGRRIVGSTQRRMEMPDSPPSSSSETGSKSTWDTIHSSLPVSYRVAIALDAFILFITFASLLLLTLYIRKQIRLRQYAAENDVEMNRKRTQMDNDVKKGGLLGKLTRKKGHVRWTSSVEKCSAGDEKGGERERVKMKLGSGEWETATWGPRSGKRDAKKSATVSVREDERFDVGMRGGGGTWGVRVNPLGRSKKSGLGGIDGDGQWKRGSLWKGLEAKKNRDRAIRSQQRIAAGYDGFRGN